VAPVAVEPGRAERVGDRRGARRTSNDPCNVTAIRSATRRAADSEGTSACAGTAALIERLATENDGWGYELCQCESRAKILNEGKVADETCES
jgi:hypothetical protein